MASPSPAISAKVVKKPGHEYTVDWVPDNTDAEYRGKRFPNAILDTGEDGGIMEPITLRELTMMRFMNEVTDKPDWTKKVFDEAILHKWKEESVLAESPPETEISERMFHYSIAELQYLAQKHPQSPAGAIKVFIGDVYKSDTAVSESTKLSLQRAVKPLEDIPERLKDWHPGSDGKVLDLVHPSLFPLIYGKSRILPIGANVTTLEDCIERCGEGNTIPNPSPGLRRDISGSTVNEIHSTSFQWLPCEVDISGDRPKIVTYINNLHPQKDRDLYHIIEDIIAASIPLWDLTLSPLWGDFKIPHRIQYARVEYDPKRPSQLDGETNGSYCDRLRHYWESTKRVVPPEPPEQFEPLEEPAKFSLKKTYGDLPLQIIVKLANIELTPDKPEYEGGTWHVEGKMNEAICASAIYYYSTSNTTPSHLSFRQQSAGSITSRVLKNIKRHQGLHDWLPVVFGLENETHTIQTLGSVKTHEGRLITFPNTLQHQVQPFKLEDDQKNGHRKILALFLVDPNYRVVSTADVPCQRLDWWWDESMATANTSAGGAIGKLPLEIQSEVLKALEEDDDGFPINLSKAKEYREALMEERKAFVLSHQQEFEATEISLCEH